MAHGMSPLGVTEGQLGGRQWSGISSRGHELALRLAASGQGRRLRAALSDQFLVNYSRPMPYAMPLVWSDRAARDVADLVSALHTLIERIVQLYPSSPDIQAVISLPSVLRADAFDNPAAARQRTAVDLCRMDFLLGPDGAPKLLEVNANCPGGVINAGESSRQWRVALESAAGEEFAVQPFHENDWLVRGLVRAYRRAALPVERAAVAFDRSGWRHEVVEIAQSFRDQGIPTLEVDPRDLEHAPALLAGRPIGYQKLAIHRLRELSTQAPRYLEQLRAGEFNVQNGHWARFVADNKLSLAVLSDPRFTEYFAADAYRHVQRHIPWSRNIARCSESKVRTILRHPERYVLKHPLSTRGAGVVLGRFANAAWSAAVERARVEHWLVQEFVQTRQIERWPGEPPMPHDISTFCLAGTFMGAFSRGAADQKTNVGQGGYTHPVVVAPEGWE